MSSHFFLAEILLSILRFLTDFLMRGVSNKSGVTTAVAESSFTLLPTIFLIPFSTPENKWQFRCIVFFYKIMSY